MIEPVRMTKIRIVGTKRVLEGAIKVLHSEAVVHIEDFRPGKYNVDYAYFDIGNPAKSASKYSELLVRLRALIASLKIERQDFSLAKVPDGAEKMLAKIEMDSAKIVEKSKIFEDEQKELEKAEEMVGFLSALKLKPDVFSPLENLAVFSGYCEGDFENELSGITKKYKLTKKVRKKDVAFALFVEKESAEKIKGILESYKYRGVQVPAKIKYKSLEELAERKKELEQSEKKTAEKLGQLKKKKGQFLVSYENYLKRENEKAEAPLRFGETANLFVVEGYAPVKKYETLKQKLADGFGKKIYVERSEKEVEFAPTQLQNPSIIGSFEFFLNLYSLPFYRELDPTFLIFITFPLFFGFMLGDVGYGITTAIIFLIVKYSTKSSSLKGLMNAMLLASMASIAFGFLFGEFFGGPYFGLNPIINREHDITLMIMITLLVGIIHLNIGYLFGFVNAKRMHGIKHALAEKGSWIVVEIGIILLLFKMLNVFYTTLPYQVYLGFAFLGAGAAIMIASGRAIEVIELAGVMSNLLSYTRLFAIGLASVALAMIVNEFATAFIETGGIMILPAILILVMGHVLNIAIGIISGFLQSLRLHYVEFFTKFYKGEGKRYNPFGG